MGYTHYWSRPAVIELPAFIMLQEDVRRICETAERKHFLAIGDAWGAVDSEPEITAGRIALNGIGAAGFETFSIPRHDDGTGNYCKTGLRPYDVVVVACLHALLARVPGVVLNSDGHLPQAFEAGRALYQEALGS